ncbi:MAG: amino acid adenylation domain-containing protein, partial [Cyclobacteriaceae bacterium]
MYKLHLSQQEIYFDHVLDSDNPQYNIGTYVIIKGDFNVNLFKTAIRSCSQVFDVFKVKNFSESNPSADIRETDISNIVIEEKDYTGSEWSESKVSHWLQDRINKPFNIYSEPLYDFVLIKKGEGEHWFYLGCHHLFSDGYGVPYVLLKYLFDKYHSLRTGEDTEFTFPSYLGLIEKSNEYLNSGSYYEDRDYWLQRFNDIQEPILQKRSKNVSFRTDSIQLLFNNNQQEKLRSYCTENKISLQDFLVAVLAIYYNSIGALDYFDFCLPTHNRTSRRERMTLGLFSKLIPCRIKLDDQTLNDLFAEIKLNQRQDYRHKQFPVSHFNKMMNDSDGNVSRPFDICLNYRYFRLDTNENELNLKGHRNDATFSKTPLEFSWCDFAENGVEDLFLEITFRKDYFGRQEIELLSERLSIIIEQLFDSLDNRLSDFEIIPQSERYELLESFNDTSVAYERDKTIVDLFEEQVSKTPQSTAVVFEDIALSYVELDGYSNQLAHYLKDVYGIGPDELVGIMQDRSEWLVISVLAVLKSGGAYVPIDPGYPDERISFIKQDTACRVILDSAELEHFISVQGNYSTQSVGQVATAENLAYVFYTSGSTGTPKGVMIEHTSLVNRLNWMRADLEISSSDVFIQKTPVVFDVSVWELFLPLISGSKLVLAKPDGHKDPVYLDELLRIQNISIIHFVPSMLSEAIDNISWGHLPHLRHVICSGEALPKTLEEVFRKKTSLIKLHNYYGPTEATVDVTTIDLSKHPTKGSEVLIGKPVANTSIYIVNERNNLQAVGIIGEILIGGRQVGKGYLNRPALTQEKFIANPFRSGERLYRSGDLGRWLADGNIEFIGRKDDQVKIRGYRIELGEIEHALSGHEQIGQAVVVAKANKDGDRELVAYLTGSEEQHTGDLRAYLKERLPGYMIPTYFVQLEALPLTANGKIDKKGLPSPEGLGLSVGEEYVAPRNELESSLAEIWHEVLQRERIGVNDDFFALGGHSLKAVRLGNEYQKRLGVKLSLKDLFIHTSISTQSELLQSSKQEAFTKIPKVGEDVSYAISDAQRRLWVLSQFEGGSAAY